MHGSRPVIRINRTEENRFVASFQADLLGSVFAVVFPENLTGAVALHRFATMIEHQYGKPGICQDSFRHVIHENCYVTAFIGRY
jgi:hypothetical protein